MRKLDYVNGDGMKAMNQTTMDILICPVCKGPLLAKERGMKCSSSKCSATFPVIDGVPVLIDEKSSVFPIDEISRKGIDKDRHSRLKEFVSENLPVIGKNLMAEKSCKIFEQNVTKKKGISRVLVIGGKTIGAGLDTIIDNPRIEFIESDISFGPRTNLICDAHSLPFKEGSLDGVIIQAVLEHVADPYKVAEEIHRVLKKDGIVYADTPFMQQVHNGRYDFTRFTHLGHRRLFRRFDEISSGPSCGPGMALSWSAYHFFLSFFRTRVSRAIVQNLSRILLFWLKYFDPYLIKKPGSYDCASGYFFIGKKSNKALSDKDIIKLYRGLI